MNILCNVAVSIPVCRWKACRLRSILGRMTKRNSHMTENPDSKSMHGYVSFCRVNDLSFACRIRTWSATVSAFPRPQIVSNRLYSGIQRFVTMYLNWSSSSKRIDIALSISDREQFASSKSNKYPDSVRLSNRVMCLNIEANFPFSSRVHLHSLMNDTDQNFHQFAF